MGPGLADDGEAETLVEAPRRIDLEDREGDRKPAAMRRVADGSDEPSADPVTLGLGQQEDASQEGMVRMLVDSEATDRTPRFLDDARPRGRNVARLEQRGASLRYLQLSRVDM